MKFSIRYGHALLCLVLSFFTKAQSTLPQLNKQSIPAIIKAMTLKEKAELVIGTGLRFAGSGPVVGEADGRVPGAAGNTMSISRLGIPGTVLSDGPAGVRIDPFRDKDSSKTYYATAWPAGTLLASSWDTSLVKKVGEAFGNEVKEYGADIILAPAINIQRDPLNGRNFEYYSEDPIVSGYIAAAMVKGIQSNGVGTSVKHFAANNQETNRATVNAVVSERALREIYLRGFEIAVKEAQPWTVMSSYNKVNGTYTSESYDLLTKILREEWGFKGYVMSDWYAGKDRVAQMAAGNDLVEPGTKKNSESVVEAVKNGTLDEKVLDKNIERILTTILKTPSFQRYNYSNSPDLKAHAVVARSAAAESMILLKNQGNTLPLKMKIKIALFGNASYETIIGGTGSGEVNVAYTVSIADGLQKAGYYINEDLKTSFITHIQQEKKEHPRKAVAMGTPYMTPELQPTADVIENNVQEADIAIFTIGRNAGEGGDRKVAENFNLSATERTLLKNVAAAFHAKGKKLIVIMNIGGVVETASWSDNADAILLAWQPGLEAGNAITDILSGAVNPSGKLATTFPVKYEDEPSSKNFPGAPGNNSKETIYEEGIYVGYRYFNSFDVKSAYPFGFGLSYTQFAYSNLNLTTTTFNKKITATVTITNTGKVAGKEVVQLYVTAPQKQLDKPSEELKAFAKTGLLKSGQSQTITFALYAKDLASFNTSQSAWIADAGNYIVKIGASIKDIKSEKTFILRKDMIVERVNKALVPQVPINEIKPIRKST